MACCPTGFLKPHRKYGTTYRLLYLLTGLQLFTILVSHGDIIMLAKLRVWRGVSFVFKTLSMVVLRFKDHTDREFLVPFNIRWGKVHVPIGLSIVFLIVLLSALANLVTQTGGDGERIEFYGGVFGLGVRGDGTLPSSNSRRPS